MFFFGGAPFPSLLVRAPPCQRPGICLCVCVGVCVYGVCFSRALLCDEETKKCPPFSQSARRARHEKKMGSFFSFCTNSPSSFFSLSNLSADRFGVLRQKPYRRRQGWRGGCNPGRGRGERPRRHAQAHNLMREAAGWALSRSLPLLSPPPLPPPPPRRPRPHRPTRTPRRSGRRCRCFPPLATPARAAAPAAAPAAPAG